MIKIERCDQNLTEIKNPEYSQYANIMLKHKGPFQRKACREMSFVFGTDVPAPLDLSAAEDDTLLISSVSGVVALSVSSVSGGSCCE